MSVNTPNLPLKANHVGTTVICCVLGVFAVFNTDLVWADDLIPHPHSSQKLTHNWRNTAVLLSENNVLSPKEAAEIARQGRDIQVLKVKKKKTPLGPIFRVKLLTKKGRVKHINVDAITGKIIHKAK